MKSHCYLFFVLLVGIISLEASPSQPICLNMIVKNESAVIKRCLASVKPLIDYWVIVDTGSNDGTQEIIREFMKGIPGELHERPWRNFAENRNEALQLAQGHGAYFLFMDADDWLEFDEAFTMPVLTHDLYKIWRSWDGCRFLNHHFIRADLPWRWIGVIHEYLDCSQKISEGILEHVLYQVGNDGASHKDPKKFEKYIVLLEESLKKDPHNVRDMISLAKSYAGANQNEKALALYESIVNVCAIEEEVFWATVQIGNLKLFLNKPLDEAINSYYRAHRICPTRVEPIYHLSKIYNQMGAFDLAYSFIKSWQALPNHGKRGVIINMEWMSEYGLLFELSLSSFYVGQYQESLEICDHLLSMRKLPAGLKTYVENNRKLCLQKVR